MNPIVTDIFFDPETTFFSGQCFRFTAKGENTFQGVVKNKVLTITKEKDRLLFEGITPAEFESDFAHYFDLHTDYSVIKAELKNDPVMAKAIAFAPGLRLLHQDFWETLCSFIISQNNNIPRITGIIENFSRAFGEKIDKDHFSFPTAQVVANLTLDDLAPIKTGFRVKYILDAAQKVAAGTVQAETAQALPLTEAVAYLCQIKGVGEKVAHCALLYGANHTYAFPQDVWMKRAVDIFYNGDVPEIVHKYAGIAQLFLFYYIRNCEEAMAATV